MRPRLKEDPKEWRNFALICCAMLLLLSGLAFFKKWIGARGYSVAVSVATIGVVVAMVQPERFRGLYRAAMTMSYWIGQVMGKVILGIFYILVLTPLGILLRILGKDLLQMRQEKKAESYWKPARKRGRLDQQF
jgi:hypothetical protein